MMGKKAKADLVRRYVQQPGGLDDLVGWLNQGPTLPGELGVAWRAAGEILGYLVPLPAGEGPQGTTFLTRISPWRIRRQTAFRGLAVKQFNALARDAPVRLALEGRRVGGRVELVPVIRADDLLPIVLCQVWQTVFVEAQLQRLKRCDRCTVWFIDHTDNSSARWCGGECRNRWWTRGRRRALKEGRARRRAVRRRS